MLLGIDVGGTFTDAVIVASGKIVSSSKAPTTHHDLLEGVLHALDKVLPSIDKAQLVRVALSTTIVTNALIEERTDKVGLCLIPGPGLDIGKVVPEEPFILSGYIDHRGRVAKELNKDEVLAACRHFSDCDVFAVAGKFAVRNPKHENLVTTWINEVAKPRNITTGSAVAGSLNFWRRANSAYYNAAVWRQFSNFATAIEGALRIRGIDAPVFILKADGGTMPLFTAKDQPVEAIFTGPAASVLGIMAMYKTDRNSVSLDIGGTTTDIALWENGLPLFASRGADISGFPTAVRAFRLKSVGIGGDSLVRCEDGKFKVGPMRKGPAMAVGGSYPALSDAMIVAGLTSFGDIERAYQAMREVALPGRTPSETAGAVLDAAVDVVKKALEEMIEEQATEPVYRVEDIIHTSRFKPELLIGVGGAAAGLAPRIAKEINVPCQVPEGAMVANAVGAAVARPTIDITLRVDTAQHYYSVAELSLRGTLNSKRFSLNEAHELSVSYLRERAAQAGIDVNEVEAIQQEEFNLVRGFNTTGKIITSRVQIKPGVLMTIDSNGVRGEMAR